MLVTIALALLAPSVGALSAVPASGRSATLETILIEAHVEGRSQLIIQGSTAQWHHLEGVAPGRDGSLDRPTVLSDALWFPTWPDVPDPGNFDCNCVSSVFTGVQPPLPAEELTVDLRLVEARGAVSVVSSPSESNGFRAVIEFDDRGLIGAEWYLVEFDVRPEPPIPEGNLRIGALIDGRSWLVLDDDTAQWHHFDYAAPGRHFFLDEPTVLNGAEWFPTWPDEPDAENRDCDCFSDVFTGLDPAILDVAFAVDLRILRGRGEITVVQQPSEDNDFTTIIEFNDNPPSGPAWYIVEFDLPNAGDLLEPIRDKVRRLVASGKLEPGRGHALRVKLRGVVTKEAQGRHLAACGQLAAFDHQVAAFGRAGVLNAAAADRLSARTDRVSDLVCGG